MKAPIFVYAEGYLEVFSTKEKAEASAEAIDVRNDIYTAAYDSEGNLLDVTVTPDNFVEISQTNPVAKQPDELRKLLLSFLMGAKGVSEDWLANASLEELVIKALNFKIK